MNPTGNEIVQLGDEWLVIGSRQELRALQSLLNEGAGGGAGLMRGFGVGG
ncbi:MAG: hypothetical protein U1G07_05610 [Verrucomicrobiota bacterium]